MAEAIQHCEAGVTYSHNKFPNVMPLPPGWIKVDYQYRHKKEEWKDSEPIWLPPECVKDAPRLMDCWTRGDWQYRLRPRSPETKPTEQAPEKSPLDVSKIRDTLVRVDGMLDALGVLANSNEDMWQIVNGIGEELGKARRQIESSL